MTKNIKIYEKIDISKNELRGWTFTSLITDKFSDITIAYLTNTFTFCHANCQLLIKLYVGD